MITREEWMRTAEHAAAAKFGERHSGWLTFRRIYAAPVAVLVALGAIGFGGYLLWAKVVRPVFGGGAHFSAGLPIAVPVLAVVLLLATVIVFRPKDSSSLFSVMLLKVFVIGSAWLGLLGWTIAYIAS